MSNPTVAEFRCLSAKCRDEYRSKETDPVKKYNTPVRVCKVDSVTITDKGVRQLKGTCPRCQQEVCRLQSGKTLSS